MNDNDLRLMILRTRSEIVGQRERLKEVEPKAQAYDAMIRILNLTDNSSRNFQEDIVGRLTHELEAVEARIKESASQNQTAPPPRAPELGQI